MISLNAMLEEVKNIKEAINRIEFKGEQNANFVLFSCQRCDFLISEINKAIEAKQNDDAEAGE